MLLDMEDKALKLFLQNLSEVTGGLKKIMAGCIQGNTDFARYFKRLAQLVQDLIKRMAARQVTFFTKLVGYQTRCKYAKNVIKLD